MKPITLQQPARVVIGANASIQFAEEYLSKGFSRLFLLTAPPILPLIQPIVERLIASGITIECFDQITAEPTLDEAKEMVHQARRFEADSVAGIGGGSVLDAAKIVAAFRYSDQPIEETFGIGLVRQKGCYLACLPTTAGTGSEVSPNSILLDSAAKLKKGIVSPFLLPDAAYIDPSLTLTVPPKVTAETGMDALSHCIEAYTNNFAHPIVDHYALEGIRLIMTNLEKAVKEPSNIEARTALAVGSYYGGLCLAPVNTAAVHALSYPLGGEYHLSHGLANAILLPPVMAFNQSTKPHKFAAIAIAAGADPSLSEATLADEAVRRVESLAKACGIPTRLTDVGIPQSAIESLATAAMQVTRLLVNNPRPVTIDDARSIYSKLF